MTPSPHPARRGVPAARTADKRAGYFVVATIFMSAAVAVIATVDRLFNQTHINHLAVLALAGAIGFIGNELAA